MSPALPLTRGYLDLGVIHLALLLYISVSDWPLRDARNGFFKHHCRRIFDKPFKIRAKISENLVQQIGIHCSTHKVINFLSSTKLNESVVGCTSFLFRKCHFLSIERTLNFTPSLTPSFRPSILLTFL